MKFSKRTHYGLVFLAQLHFVWPEYRTVKEISESDNLPPKFLEGIASDFRKCGLVEVKRGALGGYRLGRGLKEITLLEVIRCLDLEGTRRVKGNSRSDMTNKKQSATPFLKRVSDEVDELLNGITLDALPAMYSGESAFMYYI